MKCVQSTGVSFIESRLIDLTLLCERALLNHTTMWEYDRSAQRTIHPYTSPYKYISQVSLLALVSLLELWQQSNNGHDSKAPALLVWSTINHLNDIEWNEQLWDNMFYNDYIT